MILLVVILSLIVLALVVFYAYVGWKIFEKAGQPGWSALIPIYSAYILTKIIGKPWWWLLLMCIPYVGAIFGIWAIVLLAKSFGKDTGFAIGLIFLGVVFAPIMAFDASIQYVGPGGVPQDLDKDINSIGGSPAI
jgi:hypothetical protein